MSGFNPGEGWREVTAQGYVDASATTITLREDGRPDRWWVREEPVPSLPTEPYTVIRVTWRKDSGYGRRSVNPVLIRQPVGAYHQWAWSDDGDSFGDDSDLLESITGFEVLAEPRPVTAKAVLEAVHRVATVVPDSDIRHVHVHDLIDIERDWGVS